MTSTEQLERETEQTRARLAGTLEELRSMTPGRVVDEVLDYTKAGGADLLRNLGHQVSENPLPAALIGVGIVWYMMSTGKSSNGMSGIGNGSGQRWNDGFSDSSRSMPESGSGFSGKANSAIHGVKETAQSAASSLSNAASSVSQTASSAYDAISSTANRTASTAKSAASSVSNSAIALEKGALAASQGLFDFATGQPLVLLGLGLAFGATLGAAVPETEAEDRLMGETADEMKRKGFQLASDQMHAGIEAGEHLLDETAKVAKHQLTQVLGADEQNIEGKGADDHDPQSNIESDEHETNTGQSQQGGTDFNRLGSLPIH
jgi:hypothetical protein